MVESAFSSDLLAERELIPLLALPQTWYPVLPHITSSCAPREGFGGGEWTMKIKAVHVSKTCVTARNGYFQTLVPEISQTGSDKAHMEDSLPYSFSIVSWQCVK